MKTYNKKIGLLIRLLSLSSLSACFGTRQAMMDAPEKCSGSTSAHDAYSNLIGGMTPLGEAIINENSQMVKALVKNQKTDINNIGTNEPAIFLALRLKNSEIAMILFTESASRRLNVTYIDPDSGDTALHLAAKEDYSDVVNMLIGTDQIDVNSKNKCGDTPLHLAAREGHANVVQALLACKNIEKEADVNIQDTNGDTALHLAIDGKHLDVVKRLVQEEKLNLNIKNKQNRTFLYLANKSDNVEIVNAIRAAIKDIDEQVMKDLKDKENHFSIERIKYWLGKGLLNIDARDGEDARSTLLMHAAKNNDASAVKFLIDQGASVNEQDKDGDAALHIATRRSYEYEYEYENVVKLLLEARGNVNVNLQNDKRDAALHIAAYNGFENIVNMLLKEKEIDVNLKGEAGDTALSQAAYRGHAGVVKLLLQVENIDVNRQGNNEKTPLLLAAQKYYSEIVKVLLESGKNIDIGPTLDWAKRDDHASAIVTLLETYQKNKERENSVS